MNKVQRSWSQKRDKKLEKLTKVQKWLDGKYVDPSRIVELMEALIEPGARVVLEGIIRSRHRSCPRSFWRWTRRRFMICT